MDTTHFRHALEAEQKKLEGELDALGVRDAGDAPRWEFRAPALDVQYADDNEAADQAEEANIDAIVFDELVARYRAVYRALERVSAGTYGMCGVCAAPIEGERLEANPAARTCREHLAEEVAVESA